MHTFEWRYIRDEENSFGDDCAWIDYIYFPPLKTATVDAGADANVCEGSDYNLFASANNFCYLEWTSSGTGIFNDNSILDAVYTPGAEDYQEGSVILTITIHIPDDELSDEMELVFDLLPEIPSTPIGPEYVDIYYTSSTEYSSEGSEYSDYYQWELFPDYAGNIDGENTSCVINWNNSFLGEANIKVKGFNECGEGTFSEELVIMVDNTVGFGDPSEDLRTTIVPNPNKGVFKLQIENCSGIIDIQIMDVLGNVIYKNNNELVENEFVKNINISTHPEGLYFINIKGENINLVRKIIIR